MSSDTAILTSLELPPVSVVMPVYNGERYVAEAIDSILAQTHQDFEFLIIDDGSTDRTGRILAAYASRDPRIRVITQPNQGQPAALNRALALARHDWVAILDHDDISLPYRLERQLHAIMANPDIRVLGSYAIEIDLSGRVVGYQAYGPTTEAELLALQAANRLLVLIHPSVMMHRPTILALGGYDAAFAAAEDVELWSRVAKNHLVLTLPEPLVRYRIHSGSMSFNRFFTGQRSLRWLSAQQEALRHGQPVPSLSEHLRTEQGWRALHRLAHARCDWAQYALKRARIARIVGQPIVAARWFLVGIVLAPALALKRLRAQQRRLRSIRSTS